jgi:hypothetical protein
VLVDVRELITLDDVMEELGYGPNGGLVYCMEYVTYTHMRPPELIREVAQVLGREH